MFLRIVFQKEKVSMKLDISNIISHKGQRDMLEP